MTVLVDTNVILDILLKREPYAGEAKAIMTKCADRETKRSGVTERAGNYVRYKMACSFFVHFLQMGREYGFHSFRHKESVYEQL